MAAAHDDQLADVHRRLDDVHRRLEFQDGILLDVREQVQKTNGRVTKLELAYARWQGAKDAMAWRGPVLLSAVGVIAGALAEHFLH